MTVTAQRVPKPDLDALASHWQRALDAAQDALAAASHDLPPHELGRRAQALVEERRTTADALVRMADVAGVHSVPWLSSVPLRPAMLGLDDDTTLCVFDLEGVLTDSALLHAWAWGEAFDEFLHRFGDRAGRVAEPFDRVREYRDFVDGRPRLEGVQTFLRSRGIRLPLGEPDDPPGMNTVSSLARRKSEVLVHRLEQQGVSALPGARRYLEAAGRLGVRRAVLSASVRVRSMLDTAGLAPLVEEVVDADRIHDEGLRSRPAPDALLSVCRRLDVDPAAATAFTHSTLGVESARAASIAVVGVGGGELGDALHDAGAYRVVTSLTSLLDPRMVAGLEPDDGGVAARGRR